MCRSSEDVLDAIKGQGKEWIIELAVLYLNQLFQHLDFMNVDHYNWVNIVSPAATSQSQPEILAEADRKLSKQAYSFFSVFLRVS